MIIQRQVLYYCHDSVTFRRTSGRWKDIRKNKTRIIQAVYEKKSLRILSCMWQLCCSEAVKKEYSCSTGLISSSENNGNCSPRHSLIVHFLKSKKEISIYNYVIVECFKKWTKTVAHSDQEGSTVVKAFVDTLICHFGGPLQIHLDQDRNCSSNCTKKCAIFFKLIKQGPRATNVLSPIQRSFSTQMWEFSQIPCVWHKKVCHENRVLLKLRKVSSFSHIWDC